MESVPNQDLRVVDGQWRNSYARREQHDNSTLRFESDTPILDETIAIVTEKVWSFRAAFKAAAEALVGFGLSPSVVGYESVPLGEEGDELAQKNEGEAALQKVVNDEMLARSSSGKSGEKVHHSGTGEERSLVPHQEDEDDSNHAFVEAGRKEKEERRSLTRTYDVDDYEEEHEHGNR